ncbi:DUF6197 family protein, partial [Luedemannella helvata]|uniref:DUF6197 family protein n=1 Tax=Luedemannella helvata TaxID=349315 RepID=UPI003CD0AEFE
RMSSLDVTVEFTETVRYFSGFLFTHDDLSPAVIEDGMCEDEAIVAAWNDDPDRQASDVIVALRGAAQEWERIKGGAA